MSISKTVRSKFWLFAGVGLLGLSLLLCLIAVAGRSQARSAIAESTGTGFYQPDGQLQSTQNQDLTLHDPDRDKDLDIRVYYPGGPNGPGSRLPVIIFSHGAGGSRDVGPALLGYWAAHGYVVIAPTHEDSIARRRSLGETFSMKDVLGKFGTDPQLRIGRVEDDKFIIDSLPEIELAIPALKDHIDVSRVGIGGHSAGAMTTALMAGTHCDMLINGPGGPETQGLAEPRASCFLLLSGQGIGGAFDEHSWEDIDKPMMVMTGSLDSSPRTHETPESRCDPYHYARSGDKYLLFIDGAAHMSFTGKAAGKEGPGRGILLNSALGTDKKMLDEIDDYDQAAIFSCVQSSSLAFWDAYLKHSSAAKHYLEGQGPGAMQNPIVRYEHK